MTVWETFLWGAFGSIALEVITFWRAVRRNRYIFSFEQRQIGYYVVRLVVAIIAGGVAVGVGAQSKLLAIHVGVAMPLIIEHFAKAPPRLR